MTIFTPTEVERGVGACIAELERLVGELKAAASQAADAKVAYKSAFSKERLKARAEAVEAGRRITTDEVEDIATMATKDELLAHEITTNWLLTCREALRATQAKMDGFRTLSVSVRSVT